MRSGFNILSTLRGGRNGLQGFCFWPVVHAQERAQSTAPPTGRWPEAPRVPYPQPLPHNRPPAKVPFGLTSGRFTVFCEVLILVMSLILCFLVGAAQAEEWVQLPGVVQVQTDFSAGQLSIGDIAARAQEKGLGAVIFTEADVRQVSYGLPFLRNLLRFDYEENSLFAEEMVGAYLHEIVSVGKQYPQLVLIDGVESRPFYYWGSFGDGPWPLHLWNKRLAAVGLGDVQAYRELPISGGSGLWHWHLASLLLLWPLCGLAYVLVARSHPLGVRIAIGVVSLVGLVDNAPFKLPLWDAYKGNLGPAPYQHYIDHVGEQGGLVLWLPVDQATTGKPIGLLGGRIAAVCPPATIADDLLRTHNYTAFSALHSARSTEANPGHQWDKVLLQYLSGERRRPVWAIGSADYKSGEGLDEILTVFLVGQRSRAGLFEAMQQGRMYAVQGGAQRLELQGFLAKAEEGSGRAGETVESAGAVAIAARIHSASGLAEQVHVRLVRSGKVVAQFRGTTPLALRHVDEDILPGQKLYYRLLAQSEQSRLVSNPIFVEGTSR